MTRSHFSLPELTCVPLEADTAPLPISQGRKCLETAGDGVKVWGRTQKFGWAPKHQGLYPRKKSGKVAWMPESSVWKEPRQK